MPLDAYDLAEVEAEEEKLRGRTDETSFLLRGGCLNVLEDYPPAATQAEHLAGSVEPPAGRPS